MSQPVPTQGGDALKSFQLTTESIKDKSSKDYGLAIGRQINGYVLSGLQGYFYNRNARFVKNRNYANGRINVQQMFQDRFQFNGKQNYIALNWNTLQIVNRIVSGLVGRWMRRSEKIQVKAIDTLSVKEKEEAYQNIEFLLYNRKQLEELQAQSGVQLLPQDQEVPADKEELLLWQPQIQRLPEEILYETGCNDVLGSNGWFDVLKEKMLHDAAETLFVGTYTYMDDNGVIHVEWLKPENCIYSYSDYPDFRDTSWRGHLPSRKISEIRRMYGKEFNPNNPYALTEEQLWMVAQKCKEFQYWNNLQWTDVWVTSYMRPYDEWNIRTVEFELKSVDSDVYTKTTTKTSGSTYIEKGMPKTRTGKPKEKSDNQEIIPDTNWNIYRGVYLPDMDMLLEWGLKKNMIRPQDPKEIGNAEFSYSFYMPQNYAMRNLAIPEKIEAAVDGMILALLKMQQVVARMRPTGAAINEDALQAIDYGLGDDGNKAIDYKKLYDQTGDIYYRGRDAEGNPIPIPITELQNNGFLGQMDGLIKDYSFHYQILKDELGEDPNLITAAVQPRVTGENVEASRAESENATDYIYKAYSECMKITARKISCLLKDSVMYGAEAYRKIVKQDSLELRQFATDIKMLPTQFEVDKFEAMLNNALVAQPDLILFVNPFQLMQIAKEDIKMAWAFFNRGQKKLVQYQQQTAKENQDATFKAQVESARTGEEEKRKTEREKADVEMEVEKERGEWASKNAVLTMVTGLLGKGVPIPANIQPLINSTIENLMIPLMVKTEEQKAAIMQQMAQANQMAQEQQQGQQQEQPMQQPTEQINQPQQPQEVAA
jgi:hypothetical protein